MNVTADKQWRIEKRVPVTLIMVLLAQFGAGAWFISALSADVKNNSEEILSIEKSVSVFRDKNDDVKSRVIRIEEKLISQHDLLERILRRVDGK